LGRQWKRFLFEEILNIFEGVMGQGRLIGLHKIPLTFSKE